VIDKWLVTKPVPSQFKTMKARFAHVEALVVNHVAQMKANAFVSSKVKK
jgi:hypothetical protein